VRAQVAEPLAPYGRIHRAPVGQVPPGRTVEPVPRIALAQQEACVSLGWGEEFVVEHVRPYLLAIGAR
jgi:hypothetical protein